MGTGPHRDLSALIQAAESATTAVVQVVALARLDAAEGCDTTIDTGA